MLKQLLSGHMSLPMSNHWNHKVQYNKPNHL